MATPRKTTSILKAVAKGGSLARQLGMNEDQAKEYTKPIKFKKIKAKLGK